MRCFLISLFSSLLLSSSHCYLSGAVVSAARSRAKREEMNASLNAVVSDISKKIKEQEEERIAQDAENASLRSDLQVSGAPGKTCFRHTSFTC